MELVDLLHLPKTFKRRKMSYSSVESETKAEISYYMTTCYSDTKTIYKTSILNSQSVTSGTKLCTHEHVEIHIYNPIFVRTFKKDNHTFLSSPSQLTPLPQSQTKPNSNVKTRFYPSVWTVFKDVGNSQYGGLDRLDYCNSVLIRSNKNPQSTELQGSS